MIFLVINCILIWEKKKDVIKEKDWCIQSRMIFDSFVYPLLSTSIVSVTLSPPPPLSPSCSSWLGFPAPAVYSRSKRKRKALSLHKLSKQTKLFRFHLRCQIPRLPLLSQSEVPFLRSSSFSDSHSTDGVNRLPWAGGARDLSRIQASNWFSVAEGLIERFGSPELPNSEV